MSTLTRKQIIKDNSTNSSIIKYIFKSIVYYLIILIAVYTLTLDVSITEFISYIILDIIFEHSMTYVLEYLAIAFVITVFILIAETYIKERYKINVILGHFKLERCIVINTENLPYTVSCKTINNSKTYSVVTLSTDISLNDIVYVPIVYHLNNPIKILKAYRANTLSYTENTINGNSIK